MASTAAAVRASLAAPRLVASRAAKTRGASAIGGRSSPASPGLSLRQSSRAARSSSVRCRAVDLRHVIERLCAADNLTADETEQALDALIDANPAQISAFLVLMRAKGETPEEKKARKAAVKAGRRDARAAKKGLKTTFKREEREMGKKAMVGDVRPGLSVTPLG